MGIDRSTLGPVEILTATFPGNKFTGEIITALRDLTEVGTIRVLDLAVVRKALDGSVTTLRAGELRGEPDLSKALADAEESLVTDADLSDAAELVEPGNAAAILVWEDRWAARLVDAIHNSNGEIQSLELVPKEMVDELLDKLEGG